MFGWCQCGAQTADMYIYRAFLDENVVSPDKIEQLGARIDALLMGHEKMQQAKFRRAHIQGFTGAGYLVRRGIQLQAVKINNVLGKLRRTAAQHR